ncbi:hypothetical protein [Halobellus limi]|uniref:Uncharacterized protein n=1 Tax=Halobellus limi TaxID=699433 RepID=A0A1H6BCL5_9EURY|nr:hypothetical protein [Halobellus limi]SEG58372.1 hypothetical protein SAMN04488133_2750 [Halobellus limi]
MARKLAHDRKSDETEGESNGSDPPAARGASGRTLERRTYLRLGGTVVAAVLSAAGAVPTAVAAAVGSDDDGHRLRISGSGTASTYKLTVDGELTPGADASRDAEARISECTAEGAITTGERRYRFSGELRDLQVDGNAAVTIDGDKVRRSIASKGERR